MQNIRDPKKKPSFSFKSVISENIDCEYGWFNLKDNKNDTYLIAKDIKENKFDIYKIIN